MKIRKTKCEDLSVLMQIFDEARRTIASLGIDQWQDGYPSRDVIEEDVKKAQSYCVLCESGEGGYEIVGTFALIDDGEPMYDKIFDGKWLTGDFSDNYFAIHRVAISVKNRGSGISTGIIDFCAEQARNAGKISLRIDTHRGNLVMRRMLEKHGFIHCGTIFLSDGAERVAYEKIL